MAYKKLNDVTTITLGGTNKDTGKKNPMEFEGYYIRKEERPNKFNPSKPQNLYVFETPSGEVGLFAKAGIDREMRKAKLGVMTKVVDTGKTLDTGKGNPMRVFEVLQDSSNSIAIGVEPTDYTSDYDESDDDSDESTETVSVPKVSPATHPASVNTNTISNTHSLLSKVRQRS